MLHTYSSLRDKNTRSIIGFVRSARWLAPIVYCISAVAFLLDLQRDNTLAYGIVYTPLIATAVVYPHRSGVWALTGIASLLIIIGALFPVVDSDLPDLIANRFLSILAILTTATFVQHARNIQERLSAQTRRAEAAERMKTDLLTNLSQDIRTPLHSLLGILALTMVDSKPGQREVLSHASRDGRHLLATVDNLIDLSQIEDRDLQRQTINVAAVVQQAIAGAALEARERQITVSVSASENAPDLLAIGDAWAVRRILNNFLANAVRLTPPGGKVAVSVSRNHDMATVTISDTGHGLPEDVMQHFHEDVPTGNGRILSSSGGIGLALCVYLARAMQGQVVARNQPGGGAIITLALPLA